MSTNVKKPLLSAANMSRIAILAAAASILFLLEIPVVAFYKLDLSNIPVMLGAFSMGTIHLLAYNRKGKNVNLFKGCERISGKAESE